MTKQIVVLAAGNSSRFFPFSQNKHKSETILMGKPLIYWTLDELITYQAKEIIVVVGKTNSSLSDLIKNYSKNSPQVKITIVTQQEALGMADAILSVKKHLDNNNQSLDDQFFVVNAYHFQASPIMKKMDELAKEENSKVVLAGTNTNEPQNYGVIEIENGFAKSLIEKPQNTPDVFLRTVGIYLLNKNFINLLEKTPQEEYQLETALNTHIQQTKTSVLEIEQDQPSLKYPWHLLDIKNLLFKKLDFSISPSAKIAPSAVIKGDVYIGPNAIVADFAIIEGPAYIGENAVVGQFCVARKKSVLEKNAEIQRHTDCSNTIMMENAHIHSGFLGDSIIGKNSKIGAGLITANKRLDRNTIKTIVKGIKTDTKTTSLGLIMGENTKIGIQTGTMPGVILGNNSMVYPNIIVGKNVGNNTVVNSKT